MVGSESGKVDCSPCYRMAAAFMILLYYLRKRREISVLSRALSSIFVDKGFKGPGTHHPE